MARLRRIRPGGRLGLATAVALVVLLQAAGLSTASSRAGATTVVSITQSNHVTDQGVFTVSIEVADASQVSFAYFTFCQLTSPICYLPIAMSASGGSNWLSGTTKTMPNYPGMTEGVVAGYNITVQFKDNTNLTEPTLPSTFTGLTVVTSVSGEYMYRMAVQDPVYGITGTVTDSATGAAVAGATVEVTPGNNTTTTNAAGTYSFSGLLNGTYQISVSGTGYQPSQSTVTVAGQNSSKNVAITNDTGPSTGTNPPPGSSSGVSMAFLEYVGVGVVSLVVVVALVLLYRRRGNAGSP